MPVSTTHVVCGAIFGIGITNKSYRWKTVAEILTTWLTTHPLAATLSALGTLEVNHRDTFLLSHGASFRAINCVD